MVAVDGAAGTVAGVVAAAVAGAPLVADDFVWTSGACTAEPIRRSCSTDLLRPCLQIPSVPSVVGCPLAEILITSSVRSSSAPASTSPAGFSPLPACVGPLRSLLGASSASIHLGPSTAMGRSAGHPTDRSPAVLGLTAAGAARGPCGPCDQRGPCGRLGRTSPLMTEAASLDEVCSSCQ